MYKEEIPIKYKYNLFTKMDNYPIMSDYPFIILNLIIDYNKKKRRKKIKPEFLKSDLNNIVNEFSEEKRNLFEKYYDDILKSYLLSDDKGILKLKSDFIKKYLEL